MAIAIPVQEAPAAASATVTVIKTIEHLNFNTFNECTNEAVSIEGELTTRWRLTETESGHHLSGGHSIGALSGTGLFSGVTYTQINSYQITANGTLDAAGNLTTTGAYTFLFLSKGSEANLLATVHQHLTVTPDGEVVADHFYFTRECVG